MATPTQPTPTPTAPPTPPRAVILMEAATNAIVAGHFVKYGYSVEVVKDLKFCSTPLLKSAKFIVLGPNHDNSPYYEKIKGTLQKMVPERLFEANGAELLKQVRAKIQSDVQKTNATHPSDASLKRENREKEDLEQLKNVPKPEQAPPPETDVASTTVVATLITEAVPLEVIEDWNSSISKNALTETSFLVNDTLIQLIQPYLDLSSALGHLEGERARLLSIEDLPENAKTELQAQQSSFKKPLSPLRAIAKAEQYEKQVAQAAAEGKDFPPRKLPKGELYDHVIELGQLTNSLFAERAKLKISLAKVIARNFCKDKPYRIMHACGINCDYLFGTLYLYLALLKIRQDRHNPTLKSLRNLSSLLSEKSEPSTPKKGLKIFGNKSNAEDTPPAELSPEELELEKQTVRDASLLYCLDSDLNFFEPELVNAFWETYESVAYAFLLNKIKNPAFLRYLRAFMRFGYMSEHPAMISKAQTNALLNNCDENEASFLHEADKTNIVYPDESILQMSMGHIPYSFDEDLELNGQGTDKYKWDKSARKVYASQFKCLVYGREIDKWQAKVDELQHNVDSAETMMTEHDKGSKEYKLLLSSSREAKAEVSRFKKIVEKLTTIIETEKETIEVQTGHLNSLDFKIDLKEICANESKTIRRFAKLLGNLKEPFFPFLLRDNFKPETSTLYDKKTIQEAISKFEQDDPNIFSTDLANAQNPRKQVLVRFSPTFIILPCVGSMGFCMAPSNSADTGRFVLPLMGTSQTPLPRMIVDICADFRYDTAKENAGVDLMTSDTICAAYAKVRWDYRKKGKEFREKAGIYNDMQDKKNFKVHYRLYIESMEESGKKLYFKCYEMYEAFVKYIPLPLGKPKLKKN